MISHVTVGTDDLARAIAFYGAVFAPLGLRLKLGGEEDGWAGWEPPGGGRPLFVVVEPLDGAAASAGNGAMTALSAPSRAAVDKAYEAAMAAGGASEGGPGLRPAYHADFYGAYFRDPDGNKICVRRHDPA